MSLIKGTLDEISSDPIFRELCYRYISLPIKPHWDVKREQLFKLEKRRYLSHGYSDLDFKHRCESDM